MKTFVRKTSAGIVVTNNSGINYEDTTVKINYGLTGEYKSSAQFIKNGETVTIPYSEFTDSSGTRFSFAQTKPETVLVRARINGKYDWEEFK